MCGICGVMALDGTLAPGLSDAIDAMTLTLSHRGPDGAGRFSDDRAALGHRRLAIIDRAGGTQPMRNEDGTCWVVFNGEIYNHRALRSRLEARGHRFRTLSDTEVIVHAYEEYGAEAAGHLGGMFALAVYDQRRQEIYIARDRLGKKPLFYAVLDGTLLFGSEIKALRESPAWNGEIDTAALEAYFSLGYVPAPQTIYRHVRKLLPGHWLRVRNRRIEIRQYWDIREFDTDRRREPEILDELEALIATAVRDRLESEVPLGAFLSGGLDSGLVCSFMAEELPTVRTTTVAFEEAEHDESAAADLTARHLKTQHGVERVTARLDDVFDDIVRGFDEPFADSSAIPTHYVSKAARRHVTVALTGDGGDEAFGGYDFRYVPHLIEANARRAVPWPALRRSLGRIGRAWPRSRHLPRALRLGAVLENLAREPETAYYVDLCFSKPWRTRRLLGLAPDTDFRASEAYELIVAPYRACSSRHPLQRAQYADLKGYLPNDVLAKVDRMSMTHALEVRSPLLDHRLVEFAFRIPATLKHRRLNPKYLLRQLAARRLPAAVLALPKRGFTAPIPQWFRGDIGRQFEREVLSSTSAVAATIDQNHLRGMWHAHRHGSADHGYVLWASWVFERWLQAERARPLHHPASAG